MYKHRDHDVINDFDLASREGSRKKRPEIMDKPATFNFSWVSAAEQCVTVVLIRNANKPVVLKGGSTCP